MNKKGGDAIVMTRTGRESQGARQIVYKEMCLRKINYEKPISLRRYSYIK